MSNAHPHVGREVVRLRTICSDGVEMTRRPSSLTESDKVSLGRNRSLGGERPASRSTLVELNKMREIAKHRTRPTATSALHHPGLAEGGIT